MRRFLQYGLICLGLVVLVGCGGNGGTTASMPMEPTEPTEPTQPTTPPTCVEAPENPNCTGKTQAELDAERRAAMVAKLAPAIADPDGDGKFPEADELTTSKRPGVEPTYAIGGVTTIGGDELGKNDVGIKNTEEFDKMSSATYAPITDFTIGVYQRTKDKKTDTVTIYSDVTADKSQSFNDYYNEARATSDDSITLTAAIPDSTDKTTTYNTLTLQPSQRLDSQGRSLTGSGFPAEATSSSDTSSKTTAADKTFTGTFHGVPGTYTCATSACIIDHTIAGGLQLRSGSGTLTFKPTATTNDTDDVHMIAGATKDDDYLSFGYWVQTQGTGDDMKYGVNTFAGGSMPFGGALSTDTPNAAIVALNGKATYEGPATGLYAYKTASIEDGKVVHTPSAAGQFVADTSLTAYFGNTAKGSIADDDRFTISGTVDNFQDAKGNQIDDSWTVSLKADFSNADKSEAYNQFMGTTGEGAMAGQWRGAFFGEADTTNNDDMPSGVAGEFTGHFVNGHVIGAFGATKTEE